ncbi:hypothetical protein [Sporosarcina sp. A2]|uniref:hypothetical protein n=1 Tax=Sporosarcina sp. A2 TaxID=3393449 RepID=UPI003D790F24
MRKCIVCDGEMHQGFVNENTGQLWCDDICLRIDYTAAEQKEAYRGEGGGLYWTEWEVEEPSFPDLLEIEIRRANALD